MASDIPAVPPVDLRQVLYFVSVAHELNFSRAAERLRISPPALSQQVKALERHLGVQLLVRDTRQVRLTSAGEVLARSGRKLLRDGESAVLQARAVAGVINGQLQLAALHEAESTFEPFLTQFHAAYPNVRCNVVSCRHAELLGALRDRTADAALTWSFLLQRAGDSEGLHWRAVARTEVVAVLHPDNPLARADRVPRGERLRGTSVVLFEREYSPTTYDYSLEQLYGEGYPDPPVQQVTVTVRAQETMGRQLSTARSLAPMSLAVAELVRGTWEIRPFDPPWFIDGCVVWERDNSSAALMAFMAAAAAEGVQPHTGPAV